MEIKSAPTVSSSFFQNLRKLKTLLPEKAKRGILVYGGGEEQHREETDVLPWKDFTKALPE